VIEPPRFNLSNEVMVRKHVHATVLTTLRRLARDEGARDASDRKENVDALDRSFPAQVRTYLFEESGAVRTRRFDTTELAVVVSKHRDLVAREVKHVFAAGWPEEDRRVVEPGVLEGHVDRMAIELDRVIERLRARLDWALRQMARLRALQQAKGTLDPDEDALMARADRLV